jgi:hypothetical protein
VKECLPDEPGFMVGFHSPPELPGCIANSTELSPDYSYTMSFHPSGNLWITWVRAESLFPSILNLQLSKGIQIISFFYAFTHTRSCAFTPSNCRLIARYSVHVAVFPMNYEPRAMSLTLFFCRFAKGFAEMHGNEKRQINENNELELAWRMQLYISEVNKKRRRRR